MSKIAGQLLWNRVHDTVPAQVDQTPGTLTINTQIAQVSKAFGDDPALVGEPTRIQVIPLCPTASWTYITHGEPVLVNGQYQITFTNTDTNPAVINVLFWDPHSHVGPGMADYYNAV